MDQDDRYKKYIIQAKIGIKGEAFFESLVADYCIPHHITGPKDIGLDYICEWVYGDKPTGVLFAAQIKTSSEKTTKPKFEKTETGLNGLEKYSIHNSNLKVSEATLHYWHGFGIPVYLFLIVQGCIGAEGRLDCYYKRFTPLLTREKYEQTDYAEGFYKVNEGNRFIAFKDPQKRTQGFARDLFIDHVRWCYYKGLLTHLDPHSIGLEQFSEESVFAEFVKSYQEQVMSTYQWTTKQLQNLGIIQRQQTS